MKRLPLPPGAAVGDFIDEATLVRAAGEQMKRAPVHITDRVAPHSKGTPHDYYSNGDYWWPNPDTGDGLPYIQRDGQTNPANFTAHREALRAMRKAVTFLAAAFRITGDAACGDRAVRWLREFFLEEATRMSPHLTYAQAIPGVSDGRGIGIIDTLHLIDLPAAVRVLEPRMTAEDLRGLRAWFRDYLNWMNTHPNGIEERDWHNNHAVTWWAQAASYADFIGDEAMLQSCRDRFRRVLLPGQMAADGSFPAELARTKPYNYSCFVLDNMVNICLFASGDGAEDLWELALEDGRGIRKGLSFLLPYLKDKSGWPYGADVEHFDSWPVAMPFLLFAGLRYGDKDCLALWKALDSHPDDGELRRNIAIRCPYLLLA